MTNPPNIDAIIDELSEAQRAFLVNCNYADPNTVRALRRKGMMETDVIRFTPFGMVVRSALIDKEGGR
jgi:hypothetical protein